MELATRKTLPDTVEWVKVSGVAWHGDGFYYSRYPAPEQGQGEGVDQRGPPGLLPQGRHAAVAGPPDLPGRRQRAALPHRRDHRRRAVRDSDGLGPRQGQGRQRAVRRAICRAGQNEFKPVIRRDQQRHLRRHRQRRRQAAGRDQQERAERAGRPRRSETAGRGELEDRPAREAGTAAGREHRRRQAVRDLSEGRDDAGLRLQPGRHARERGRAARARHRRRLRRQPGRHVRLLHVQLAEHAADDLPLRHRDEEEHDLPPAEGARLRPGRSSRRSRSSTRARTARRSRCSSCTRRA